MLVLISRPLYFRLISWRTCNGKSNQMKTILEIIKRSSFGKETDCATFYFINRPLYHPKFWNRFFRSSDKQICSSIFRKCFPQIIYQAFINGRECISHLPNVLIF